MKLQYNSIEDILAHGEKWGLSFWDVVKGAEMEAYECDADSLDTRTLERIDIFKSSIVDGIEGAHGTASGLSGGQAQLLSEHAFKLLGPVAQKALTYAIAVNEANSHMFRIVACPTAGSCGVMPGCMLAVGEYYGLGDDAYLRGFYAAAGIGNVITEQACVAGAVGGCQAEVGTAAAMAAGAVVAMLEGTNEEIAHAMSLCLKNVLGLACDPVAGLVEVPCVKRNGIYAVHAITAAEMAFAGLRSHIPPDEVIEAMNRIGRSMPAALRETSEGGLATTKTGLEIAARVKAL